MRLDRRVIVPWDQHEAMARFSESLAIASELGMRPLMDRVVSHRVPRAFM